ncbi:unnamed protein product, partial [Symbiodinium sp. KB8]
SADLHHPLRPCSGDKSLWEPRWRSRGLHNLLHPAAALECACYSDKCARNLSLAASADLRDPLRPVQCPSQRWPSSYSKAFVCHHAIPSL